MTLTTKITCDACGKDLAEAPTYRRRLRLQLETERNPYDSTRQPIPWPLDGGLHFCDQRCLARWLAAQDKTEAAESRAWDIHREQLQPITAVTVGPGVSMDTGTITLDPEQTWWSRWGYFNQPDGKPG